MVQPAETVAPDADTAALIAAGAALDQEAAPPPVDPATGKPPAPVDWHGEARELVNLVCGTCEAIYEDTGLIFSEATRAKLAVVWAPVLEKYGYSASDLFGQWSAEISACIVTIPIILAARKVIQSGKAKADAVSPSPTSGAADPLDFAAADPLN